ncbi:MAG: hypothetical protein M5U26_08920 [Planctomycetota bacterium]|nr:hypothetical protein [Planctomycetota bacterium]
MRASETAALARTTSTSSLPWTIARRGSRASGSPIQPSASQYAARTVKLRSVFKRSTSARAAGTFNWPSERAAAIRSGGSLASSAAVSASTASGEACPRLPRTVAASVFSMPLDFSSRTRYGWASARRAADANW